MMVCQAPKRENGPKTDAIDAEIIVDPSKLEFRHFFVTRRSSGRAAARRLLFFCGTLLVVG